MQGRRCQNCVLRVLHQQFGIGLLRVSRRLLSVLSPAEWMPGHAKPSLEASRRKAMSSTIARTCHLQPGYPLQPKSWLSGMDMSNSWPQGQLVICSQAQTCLPCPAHNNDMMIDDDQ